jgi:predicted transcriptional regulator
MNYNCERAMKLTIPAVRAAVSQRLSSEHDMSETEIAKALGIAQAAVSKYIAGRYSLGVKRLVGAIREKKLEGSLVRAMLAKKGKKEISKLIEGLAASDKLVKIALEYK